MALAVNGGRGLASVQSAAGEPATDHADSKNLPVLMLGALGVVFGDIGTSPIYAFREALHSSAGDGIVDRGHLWRWRGQAIRSAPA
jgi:KUP system potassium uptake protein